MAALLDNFVGEESQPGCPRLQVYNDGTGLVIEYPWYFSEDEENGEPGFVRQTINKVATAMTQMAPQTRLCVDLAVVGGVVCGSLFGIMTTGPLSLGGMVGAAVRNGFLAGVMC